MKNTRMAMMTMITSKKLRRNRSKKKVASMRRLIFKFRPMTNLWLH